MLLFVTDFADSEILRIREPHIKDRSKHLVTLAKIIKKRLWDMTHPVHLIILALTKRNCCGMTSSVLLFTLDHKPLLVTNHTKDQNLTIKAT